MVYGAAFLKQYGTDCTILRTPNVKSKVSLRVATKSIYYNHREALREGLILSESNLQGGELFQVGSEKYLARSVVPDYADGTGQTHVFASKINTTITHKRQVKADDGSGNNVLTWSAITALIYAHAQVVTAALRQYDPGLMETTTMMFEIPATTGMLIGDRIEYNGQKLRIDDIDDVQLPGIYKVQCSKDNRQP